MAVIPAKAGIHFDFVVRVVLQYQRLQEQQQNGFQLSLE
jgi:hypothetical protein